MTCASSKEFMETFLPLSKDLPPDRNVVIAPPFTAISSLATLVEGTQIKLSSQNVHWEDSGAFTAEIAPSMLLEHDVKYAIVGHS